MPADDACEIRASSPASRSEAFALLLTAWPEQVRSEIRRNVLHEIDAGRIDWEGIWEARRQGTLVGAAWCQLQPGRVASVWQPVASDVAIAVKLVQAAVAAAYARGAVLAQVLLEKNAEAADVFRAAGFTHSTDLQYLVCWRRYFPEDASPSSLSFEPYDETQHDRLCRLIEATYQETLDCPELNGVRSTKDVLESYRAMGEFAPQRWLLVQEAGQDIGCLLLADHPQDDQWELVYLGIVPALRGRGLGLLLTRQAQWLAGQANRARLVLAVDAKNRPALGAYLSAAFTVCDERQVWLKGLAEDVRSS